MLLRNKVAIVTGSSKGIGRGIALKFAREGCDMVICARNEEEVEKVASEVNAIGRKALAAPLDVSNRNQVEAMVEKTIVEFGKIDILVNNAGAIAGSDPSASKSIADIPEEEWDRIVGVNLKGAFLTTRSVVPHMKKNGSGNIINFTSLGAVHPPTVSPHYHASKSGIIGMTYDTARELGTFNIRVNAIMPGPIRTPFFDKLVASMTEKEKEAFFAGMARSAPLQRVGTPEDCAGVALFLASDLSAYVTAALIPVTGGLPLQPSV
ncbi:MAG: SDR family NAD(P)-dependent oxidoreductase [Bacillota bacterium]|nr:SDR family NAD(P)-dependent oxidoreductase [Bacillota bacterium]